MVEKNQTKNNQKKVTIRLGADQEVFFENLATMVASDIIVSEALELLKEEVKTKSAKKSLDYIKSEVENGKPFWKILENTKILPERFVSIIRIGEESGRLSQNMELVVDHMRNDKSLKSKLITAFIYPGLVMIVMIVVGAAISLFALPKLAAVYANMRTEIPAITQIIIDFGELMQDSGMILVPSILISLFIFIYIVFFFKPTKIIGQEILFALPLTRKIIREIEINRLGYMLGTLIKSGLPIIYSLNSLKKASAFKRYEKFYEYLSHSIEDGISFKKSFDQYSHSKEIIPISVQHIIATGEETGNLADMLIKIGKMYKKKNNQTIKNFTVLLEPVLLIIVALAVATIAIAVVLPLYNLIGNLGF